MDVPVALLAMVRTDRGDYRAHLRSSLDGPSLCGLPLFETDPGPASGTVWTVEEGTACSKCLSRLDLIRHNATYDFLWRRGELTPELLDELG